MKKALILTPSFLPTYNGMTYATMGHARILSDLGLETTIISNECPESHLFNEYGLFNVNCLKFPIYGSDLFWSPVKGPVIQVLDEINAIKPDYIFVEGWYNWGIYLLTQLPESYLKIVCSHGSADNDVYSLPSLVRRLGYFIYDTINTKNIMQAVDGIIFLSSHKDNKRFRDFEIAKRYSIPSIIIPNRNVEDVYVNKLHYLNKTTTGFNVAVIGEMSHNKNQCFIIDNFAQLDKSINIHFFYPKDNRYSEKLKKKSFSFLERIIFHKGLDRIAINEFIKHNIDLTLILSRTEAQPIIIMDSLLHGIPFVSTNVGCMSDFLGGIICSLDKIVENVNLLQRDLELRRGFIAKAKQDFELLKYDGDNFNKWLDTLESEKKTRNLFDSSSFCN